MAAALASRVAHIAPGIEMSWKSLSSFISASIAFSYSSDDTAAAPAPAPVVDPAALSYYQGLLAQGYDPASAQMYTQQYYPGFQA